MTERVAPQSQAAIPAPGGAAPLRPVGAPVPPAAPSAGSNGASLADSLAQDRLHRLMRSPSDQRLPATAVSLGRRPASTPGALAGVRDGAVSGLQTVAQSAREYPLMVAGVVAGYHVVARTPAKAFVDRKLLNFTGVTLAGYAASGAWAVHRGDRYGVGEAIGKGLVDVALEFAPGSFERVADFKRSLTGAAKLDDVARQVRLIRRFDLGRSSIKMSSRMAGTVSTAHSGRLYLTTKSTTPTPAENDKAQGR